MKFSELDSRDLQTIASRKSSSPGRGWINSVYLLLTLHGLLFSFDSSRLVRYEFILSKWCDYRVPAPFLLKKLFREILTIPFELLPKLENQIDSRNKGELAFLPSCSGSVDGVFSLGQQMVLLKCSSTFVRFCWLQHKKWDSQSLVLRTFSRVCHRMYSFMPVTVGGMGKEEGGELIVKWTLNALLVVDTHTFVS